MTIAMTSTSAPFVAAAENALAAGDYDAVSNAELERVMTACVKLYTAKAEAREELPPPVTAERVTPTEIVVVVSEMIKTAGLNLFDLSMWFRR